MRGHFDVAAGDPEADGAEALALGPDRFGDRTHDGLGRVGPRIGGEVDVAGRFEGEVEPEVAHHSPHQIHALTGGVKRLGDGHHLLDDVPEVGKRHDQAPAGTAETKVAAAATTSAPGPSPVEASSRGVSPSSAPTSAVVDAVSASRS